MARVDVIMPQMGESIAEGTVSKWLKQIGDQVKRDEPILEISTDKVDAEIPAPATGVLAEIKVQEGETVEVQTVVAVLETERDGASAGAGEGDSGATGTIPEPAPPPSAAPAAPPAPAAPAAPAAPVAATAPSVPESGRPAAPRAHRESEEGGAVDTLEDRLRKRSTPLVRKIAAEHGVDLREIEGTGLGGRVTKKDILGFIDVREAGAAARPGVPVGVSGGPAAQAPAAAAPAGPPGAVVHPTVQAREGDRVEPMSKIRKLTADHMVASRRTAAHVSSFYEVDFSRIARIRRARKAEYAERGANLTYLSFIVKVAADNLRRHPVVNASVSGDNIIYRAEVNVGIAVALDWGLIVPVVRNADELSMVGLSKRIADLADRARSKRLNPDEVQHGTFTVTNPGTFGSYVGTPIINQPQVAILGVGAIEKRPKVMTLDDGQDVIAIRTMGMLCLSYDHRIVDGADADRFMADVKRDLEEFSEGAL